MTWNVHTVLEGHTSPVNSVCSVTVGGRNLLASASHDKTGVAHESYRLWRCRV